MNKLKKVTRKKNHSTDPHSIFYCTVELVDANN